MRKVEILVVLHFTLVSLACSQAIEAGRQEGKNVRSHSGSPQIEQTSSRRPMSLPLEDPQIIVSKAKRQVELYSRGVAVRTYRAGLGFNPVDDKVNEGDGCTPEGEFYVFTKNTRSAYYLSLGVSYPNLEDAARGLRDGLISKAEHDSIADAIRNKKTPPQNTALGGLIYIHGHGSSKDWTLGCVALDNENIRELFEAITVGTPVLIKP